MAAGVFKNGEAVSGDLIANSNQKWEKNCQFSTKKEMKWHQG